MGKCWEFLGGSNSFPFLTFSFSHVRFLFLWESVCLYQERTKPQTDIEVEERGRKVYGPIFRSFPPFPIYTKAKANSAAICVNDEEEIKGLGAWWGRSDLEFNAQRGGIDFSAPIFGKNIAIRWRKCIPMDPPLCQRLCPVPSRK